MAEKSSISLFCPSCGNKILAKHDYCMQCGFDLKTPIEKRRPFYAFLIIPMIILGGLSILLGILLLSGLFDSGIEKIGFVLFFIIGPLLIGGGTYLFKK